MEISSDINWRPHLFAKDGYATILDILDSKSIPELQLQKYVEAMNAVPDLRVSVVIVQDSEYTPNALLTQCFTNGFGIIAVMNGVAREIIPTTARRAQDLTSTDQVVIPITPRTPYGNLLGRRKCLGMCRKQLLWLELNLPRKSFEVIYDHIEKGDLVVRSVKLLRGVDDKLDIDFLKEFEAFKEDLRLRKIRAELRVYLDRKIFKLIHARYFYSLDDQGKEIAFQVPPINSLSLDAWDSISPVTKVPPFDSLWRSRSSVDILKDWAKVKDAVAKHLQNKELEQSRSVLANL